MLVVSVKKMIKLRRSDTICAAPTELHLFADIGSTNMWLLAEPICRNSPQSGRMIIAPAIYCWVRIVKKKEVPYGRPTQFRISDLGILISAESQIPHPKSQQPSLRDFNRFANRWVAFCTASLAGAFLTPQQSGKARA
jgi:hypothetical protein